MQSLSIKADQLVKKFQSLPTEQERYQLLIAMGNKLPIYHSKWKNIECKVHGCQSIFYLKVIQNQDHSVSFFAYSDALISKGLAAILLFVYDQETPENILKFPPTFLQELGILTTLSLNRSNGLAHIYRKLQKECAKIILETSLPSL